MLVQTFMAIHYRAIETFQCGRKWRTDRHYHAQSPAWLIKNSAQDVHKILNVKKLQ